MLFSKWLTPTISVTLVVVIVATNPLIPKIFKAAQGNLGSPPRIRANSSSIIVKKDLAPDTLATSIPVAVTSHNERVSSQVLNKDLLLRSSSHNISGVGGYSLFALPILASDLSEILQTAQGDLQSRDGRASTLFYTVKTTNWTFSVVTANTSIRYASIEAVLKRFLKLSAQRSAPDAIVSTRVGVLFNGSSAVADINISPSRPLRNGSFVPFSGFGRHQNFSISTPVEIVKVTPYGSSCAYEVVNEKSALAPFQGDNEEEGGKLKARQLESEILAHIGHTVFASTVNIWRRRDGLPVEVKIWALKALLHVAYWQFIASSLLTALDLSMSGNDDLSRGFFELSVGLDTGIYVLGRLAARFVVHLVHTAGGIRPGAFTFDDWKQIFEMFLKPLQEMREYDDGWAMDGVIFESGVGRANSSDTRNDFASQDQKIVALWQIWMGDFEEYDH